MKNLFFGTAGIPLSTSPSSTLQGIRQVRKLGLAAMELEFVHSVNIKEDKAEEVKRVAKEENVLLTCHGQYYINLNSLEKKKIEQSKKRILNAAKIANLCGAYSVCFHAAFYMKKDPAAVYNQVKKEIKEIIETLKQENNRIWVRPETTGKPSQFGDLNETLNLSAELEQVMPCIDFSHLHARSAGKNNTYAEFSSILEQVEKKLGKEGLKNLHAHISGIEYTDKGERRHLILEESDFNYKDLIKALKDFKAKGIIICESPNIEMDALLLKKAYENA